MGLGLNGVEHRIPDNNSSQRDNPFPYLNLSRWISDSGVFCDDGFDKDLDAAVLAA